MKGGIRWYMNTLVPGMAIYTRVMEEAIETIIEDMAREIQDYMKSEAPWQDQTGAAREGLSTATRHEGGSYFIDLYHTVDYGIWLEFRWNGQYAIIQPTIERYGPMVMGALSGTHEVAE